MTVPATIENKNQGLKQTKGRANSKKGEKKTTASRESPGLRGSPAGWDCQDPKMDLVAEDPQNN